MKLRVAEVGIGGISGAHIPAWNRMEDVELVAICDIRPEKMDRFDGQIHARKYTDFDEMLEEETFDILDIPQSDGYYNELRYFADCVKEGKKPEIMKPQELEAVLDVIAQINAAK